MIIDKEMQWNTIKSKKIYNIWLENNKVSESCETDSDKIIRDSLFQRYESIKNEIESSKSKAYAFDYLFGLELYEFFQPGVNGFLLSMAENIQFWSRLSMKVIPDIVYIRWSNLEKNENRFHTKPSRVWLNQIWWYIHLSWAGTKDETKNLLKNESFTTDTIMNLVDRSGTKGFYIDSYRLIMDKVALTEEKLLKPKGLSKEDFFRNVMKLNTSKLILFEPVLYENGVEGYVSSLIKEALE